MKPHLAIVLLSLPLFVSALFDDCSCPSMRMSSVCPTSTCVEPIEANCELACPKDTTLYYKTGLPWKRATNVSCVSGLYHADLRPGVKNIWHITCAKPPSCNNCAELMYNEACPEGYLCENALSEVRMNGCSRLSCREGELTIVNPNMTFTEVYTLMCSEGGSWTDVRERIYRNISAVTCAMKRSCQTCRLPEELTAKCREDTTCYKNKMSLGQTRIGNCRVAACDEREFMIRAQSRLNETVLESNSTAVNVTQPVIYDGASELVCNEQGEWTIETFKDWVKDTINLGPRVDAICYWPKCKRCWVEEMSCPPGEICSIDWMMEPDRTQECDVATCKNGTEMVFTDEYGILRTVQSLRCNDESEWVVIPTYKDIEKATRKVSLFDDGDYIDGAEQLKIEEEAKTPPVPTELRSRRASVTCKKVLKACESCPDLKKSTVCPGGPERGCNEVIYMGGSASDQCRVITCGPESELWSYHEMRWNKLDSYLECTGKAQWTIPGGLTVPNYAEIRCKYAGDCACAGARLGTASACKTTWATGCDYGAVDLFSTEADCSTIKCRYGGKLAIFNAITSKYVKTIDGYLTCGGNGTYLDQYGNKYTYLESAVTCHSWEGPRHCARACTWAPQDSDLTKFTEWSDEHGCRNLRCKDDQKMQLHDTEKDGWISRKSVSCTQTGYWTSAEDKGAVIFPYKKVDKNFIEVRCVPANTP